MYFTVYMVYFNIVVIIMIINKKYYYKFITVLASLLFRNSNEKAYMYIHVTVHIKCVIPTVYREIGN